MKRVKPVREPATFDARCRKRGRKWLKANPIYYPGSKEGHIPTRSASERSGAFPWLARRVNMQQHAELPCRGNTWFPSDRL